MGTAVSAPTVVVVMGVAASGKSTLGRLLARRRGVPFAEGDDLHPAENIARMSAGEELDDEDRAPWLRALTARIRRIDRRAGHFMPAALLGSQYDALEPLRVGEPGLTVDAVSGPEVIVEVAQAALVDFEVRGRR
ncbi:gluconokinase [Kitasatospora sp. NBC_00315]|uniref:gluconokinase n=1 Tax=Kitasatospora sp. NBC_00315 TaxID=2975963 RepID=UPI0032554996